MKRRACTVVYARLSDVKPLEFQAVAALALDYLLSSRAAQGTRTSTLTGQEVGAQR